MRIRSQSQSDGARSTSLEEVGVRVREISGGDFRSGGSFRSGGDFRSWGSVGSLQEKHLPLILQKFENLLMRDGQKQKSRKILQSALRRSAEMWQEEDKSALGGDRYPLGRGGDRSPHQREVSRTRIDFSGRGELNALGPARARSLPQALLLEAVEKVRPAFAIRKQRVAGRTYDLPIYLHTEKQIGVAIRWIVTSASRGKAEGKVKAEGGRGGKTPVSHGAKAGRGGLTESLAREIVQAMQKKGEPFQKKLKVSEFAEMNKNLIRYRF